VVRLIVSALGIYLLAGLIFAIPFVTFGVGRIDGGAKESRWGFRLIVIPGVIALWPLLLRSWLNSPVGAEKP
jgi:hypothetical protein